MKRYASLFALALSLLASSTASADVPCEMGGEVARSSNGRFLAVSGPHGCRAHPTRDLRVVRAGRRGRVLYIIHDIASPEAFLVSDDGRYLILDNTRSLVQPDDVLTVYRDGGLVGSFNPDDLLGATHAAVRERLYLELSLRGRTLRVRVLGRRGVTRVPLRSLRASAAQGTQKLGWAIASRLTRARS